MWREGRSIVEHDDRARLEGTAHGAFPNPRYVNPGLCHAMLPRDASSLEAALDRLKEALLQVGGTRAQESSPRPARARQG